MDNSGEGSQAREQPGSGPTPAPESMCSCIPQEPLDVPGLRICDAQPSLKHLTESFAWGRIIPMSAAAPPCLQQLRLHGVRGPLEEDQPQSNGGFSLFCLFNIFLYLLLFFYSYHSENEVPMLFCMILLPEGLLHYTNAHRHLHISKAFVCVFTV